MKTIISIFWLVVLSTLSACSASSGSSGGPDTASAFNLAGEAFQSIPLINGSVTGSTSSLVTLRAESTLAAVNQDILESFFKLECRNEEGTLDFCPDNDDVDYTTLDYKFSTTTLIGLIQHADMYLANVFSSDEVPDPETGVSSFESTYKTCQKGSGASALSNHTAVYSPENANTFVVDFGTLFDCVGAFEFGDTGYALYSKSVDDLIFAALVSRKQVEGTVDYVGVMSDIFQSYIRRDSNGEPVILGFNLASFDDKDTNDSAGRAVLITNFSTHKFIVKYIGGVSADTYYNVVAMGKAGYDSTNKNWVSGYYMAKLSYGTTEAETVCIENGDTPSIVEDSYCADVAAYFGDNGMTTTEVYTYLEASETDQQNLAGFNTFFDDNEFLDSSATTLPANNTDYFPDSIAAQ
ncbi:MAG: hypothetical protein HQM16_13855 [Deltaproteobacteria bacterium]|nr:hypothetical protein [Deltaproteobacteria bacterium]